MVKHSKITLDLSGALKWAWSLHVPHEFDMYTYCSFLYGISK